MVSFCVLNYVVILSPFGCLLCLNVDDDMMWYPNTSSSQPHAKRFCFSKSSSPTKGWLCWSQTPSALRLHGTPKKRLLVHLLMWSLHMQHCISFVVFSSFLCYLPCCVLSLVAFSPAHSLTRRYLSIWLKYFYCLPLISCSNVFFIPSF